MRAEESAAATTTSAGEEEEDEELEERAQSRSNSPEEATAAQQQLISNQEAEEDINSEEHQQTGARRPAVMSIGERGPAPRQLKAPGEPSAERAELGPPEEGGRGEEPAIPCGGEPPRGAPSCAGCGAPIRDKFIFSVIDLHWHQDCVQCFECSAKLDERCYTFEGRLYCKPDYWRRFGPKCFACREPIERSELVQRIKGNRVYHLKCFACTDCRKPLRAGELFHLLEASNRLLCKQDYASKTGGPSSGGAAAAAGVEQVFYTTLTPTSGPAPPELQLQLQLVGGKPTVNSPHLHLHHEPTTTKLDEDAACEQQEAGAEDEEEAEAEMQEEEEERVFLASHFRRGRAPPSGAVAHERLEDEENHQLSHRPAHLNQPHQHQHHLAHHHLNHNHNHPLERTQQQQQQQQLDKRRATHPNQQQHQQQQASSLGAHGPAPPTGKRKRRRKRAEEASPEEPAFKRGLSSPACNPNGSSRGGESILHGISGPASNQQPPPGSILAAAAAAAAASSQQPPKLSFSPAASDCSSASSSNNSSSPPPPTQQQQHHLSSHLGPLQLAGSGHLSAGSGAPTSSSASNQQSSGAGGAGHKPTRVRTVLNERQLQTLRDVYASNPRPDALLKEQLVDMTGLSPRVIRVWFQNKRCKDKKKSILYKQMQQHEKDGRQLAGLGMGRGVPLVAASPVQYDDGQSSVSSSAGAGAGAQLPANGDQQPAAAAASNQEPLDIHAYQPPWKSLVEYAAGAASPNSAAAPATAGPNQTAAASSDQGPGSPRYQQLMGKIHGYLPDEPAPSYQPQQQQQQPAPMELAQLPAMHHNQHLAGHLNLNNNHLNHHHHNHLNHHLNHLSQAHPLGQHQPAHLQHAGQAAPLSHLHQF